MKKLLATLILLPFLLAGCSGGFTANEKSYLDEKIKCKKLAEERVKELGENKTLLNSTYSAKKDTCVMAYRATFGGSNDFIFDTIEDILKTQQIAHRNDSLLEKEEDFEEWEKQKKSFDEQFELYFGEDAK